MKYLLNSLNRNEKTSLCLVPLFIDQHLFYANHQKTTKKYNNIEEKVEILRGDSQVKHTDRSAMTTLNQN